MILQKSFYYSDLLQNFVIIIIMLKKWVFFLGFFDK